MGQALLQSKLATKLKPILPNVDLSELAEGGATSIRELASSDELPAVLGAYNDSMRSVWYLALGLAGLILLASFGLEWKNVKGQKSAEPGNEGGKEEAETGSLSDVDRTSNKDGET